MSSSKDQTLKAMEQNVAHHDHKIEEQALQIESLQSQITNAPHPSKHDDAAEAKPTVDIQANAEHFEHMKQKVDNEERISQEEARELESMQSKAMNGVRPPKDSPAARAKSIADKQANAEKAANEVETNSPIDDASVTHESGVEGKLVLEEESKVEENKAEENKGRADTQKAIKKNEGKPKTSTTAQGEEKEDIQAVNDKHVSFVHAKREKTKLEKTITGTLLHGGTKEKEEATGIAKGTPLGDNTSAVNTKADSHLAQVTLQQIAGIIKANRAGGEELEDDIMAEVKKLTNDAADDAENKEN